MDAALRRALAGERTVDITTIGRRSGVPRRIETWIYHAGGEVYLAGSPGRRDWYANLEATPALTLHLKGSVVADLPATGRPITGAAERRKAFTAILEVLDAVGSSFAGLRDLDAWVAGSPLVHLLFDGEHLVPGAPGAVW
jgi:deazaflavin-dependent oxidoreductase (nitroreductase family)